MGTHMALGMGSAMGSEPPSYRRSETTRRSLRARDGVRPVDELSGAHKAVAIGSRRSKKSCPQLIRAKPSSGAPCRSHQPSLAALWWQSHHGAIDIQRLHSEADGLIGGPRGHRATGQVHSTLESSSSGVFLCGVRSLKL